MFWTDEVVDDEGSTDGMIRVQEMLGISRGTSEGACH